MADGGFCFYGRRKSEADMNSKKKYRIICKGGKMDSVFSVNRLRCKKSKSKAELHFLVDERKGVVTWTKFRSPLFKNYKLGYCRTIFKMVDDVSGFIRPDHIGLKCNKKTPSIRGRVITAINNSPAGAQRVLVINDYFVTLTTVSGMMGSVSVIYYQRIK